MDKLYDRLLAVGDKIRCHSDRDLKNWALNLSSEGYGIAIFGYHDLYDHILTITALPEDGDVE